MKSIEIVCRYPSVREEYNLACESWNTRAWFLKQGYLDVVYPSLEMIKTDGDVSYIAFKGSFNNTDYLKGLERLCYVSIVLGKYIQKMIQLCAFTGLEYPTTVEVIPTKYGSGGRYHPEVKPPQIIVRVDHEGNTFRNDSNIIPIHEFTHIVLHEVIKKYGLSHALKEALIDFIVGFVNNFSEFEFCGISHRYDGKLSASGEFIPAYEVQANFFRPDIWNPSLLNHLGVEAFIRIIDAQAKEEQNFL